MRRFAADSGGRMAAPCPARWLPALLLALAASAQDRGHERVVTPLDPYTLGEPGALQRAGYASLGPFPFGERHRTSDIEELLGSEQLAWIETAHFRLGCSVSPLRLRGDGGAEWMERTRGELKRLATRLPNLRADIRELDPWLRAHLIAQRLEDLYTEVAANLKESERDPGATALDGGHGRGPYLGLHAKFTVLLVRNASSHARYTRAHLGRETEDPIRHHDQLHDTVLYAASEQTCNGLLQNDLALHAHVVFNVAHNLYSSYRGYDHGLPAWIPIGLGHWHARRISPQFPAFDRRADLESSLRPGFWQWDKRVPDMLRNGTFEPLEQFCERNDATAFGIEQHIQGWAFVDFLMRTRKEPFLRFVRLYKEPFRGHRRPVNAEEQRDRQQHCMQKAMRSSPAELHKAWSEFVRKGAR